MVQTISTRQATSEFRVATLQFHYTDQLQWFARGSDAGLYGYIA
jgi:hypothetical protein